MSDTIDVYIKPYFRCRYKQKLNENILALIYFYPNGTSRATNGYCSSRIALEGADIFDERDLRVKKNMNNLLGKH